MRAVFLVFLVLLVAGAVLAVEPPRARVNDGWIEVSLSRTILDDEDVRQRAESGLTATLLVLDRTSRSAKSMARIAFRYEPWDEVFLVLVSHADGTKQNSKVDDLAALGDYLHGVSLKLRRDAGELGEIDVEVRFVPFSSEEAIDAREWFLDTLGATPKGSSAGGITAVEGVVDVLLATSIEARPVASWNWRIHVARKEKGDP